MAKHLKLSVLDQSPAAGDKTQDHAIRESLALAQHCDALGYHRSGYPSTTTARALSAPRQRC